jgi:tetratricopeptide (TPR) repeat protein
MIRAISLAGLGRKDEALAESDRAVTEAPDNALVRKTRATIRYNFGERDLAIEDYDALIKQSPTVDYYLTRAQLWTAADTAKRDADIKAALALEPTSIKALALRAATAIDAGNFKAAQTDMDTVAKADKDGETILELRVQFFEKQHRGTEALRVLDEHLAKHPDDAMALNERCWTKATFNLELQTAVADCDASLKLRPNIPATLDSRAFAKLRLGATDAAIADYDSALKLAPAMSSSLYGRAVARARKADEAGARSDLAEARKLSPDIDTRFAGFGVTLPPALASSVPQAARPPTN